ncbi:TetR/AcrR family transcriptional regulator [Streptomyces sp. NPDC086549]|uniref:TetR/AcrR family transcriptional regulator n=1 Tax=Streptomyces sp. NPDC086549 TaxID=3365752 RepID=UPI00382FDB68
MTQALTGRQRQKQRTRRAISDAAISLFLRHGFDPVSVVDIAAAAEVSKPTLFNYFPAKEDLVVHRFADHRAAAATAVRERPAGMTPLAALHRDFVAALARRDPITGLNDHPEVVRFHALVYSTPSLVSRLGEYLAQAEDLLARELADAAGDPAGPDITARLLAGQVIASQRVLAHSNWLRILAGDTADAAAPRADADAGLAFDGLRAGLGESLAHA